MGCLFDRDKLLNLLKEQQIDYDVHEHEEVFTVEQMMPHVAHLLGVHCKNLFLKDKKKTGFWLLSARHDASVNLNGVAKALSISGGLRLADESQLFDKVGVGQGCVTPFALLNDSKSEVKFIVDSEIWNGDDDVRIYFHPMVNCATLGMSRRDFKRFMVHRGFHPLLVDFK